MERVNPNLLNRYKVEIESLKQLLEVQEETVFKQTALLEKSIDGLKQASEELESANEELKQTNEELESTTEELRVANEDAQKATKAAEKKADELERFNKVAVGRELAMRELKAKIEELEEKLKAKG
jgi:chromosome segregation ATPase